MNSPQVDIGIPVFNRARYVAHAIESVIAQSYPHWRLTISEDRGPTTAVTRAVEPYLGEPRIHYVTPGQHLGLARNKSSLVARGQGRYVALLDDDDCWLPAWLALRVDFLEQHTECVLAWAGHFDIDETGARLKRSPLPFSEGVHSSSEFVRAMIRTNLIATPSVLVRRDAYLRAGTAFDPRFLYINDYEMWLRLGLLGPVGFLRVHDSSYRVHGQQMSWSHRRALDHLHLVEHVDRLLQAVRPELRLHPPELRRQRADWLLSAALDAAQEGHSKTAARRIVAAAMLTPRALLSGRALGAVAAVAGGKPVRRRIGTMRSSCLDR